MRLWSIHPKYLDAKGLVVLWREGLLAQKVLQGETRGYRHHPQLDRFRNTRDPVAAIGRYLQYVHEEAQRRNYKFDQSKISRTNTRTKLNVNSGQIAFEKQHLLRKLKSRDRPMYLKARMLVDLDVHPFFRAVPGEMAEWEITGK